MTDKHDMAPGVGRTEFVALAAMTMALSALSIDVVLPAFSDIRAEFGLASDSPETAGIVTAFLVGLALPQLVYGLLADRYGRKPLLYVGFTVFAVGVIVSATAGSLSTILVGRFIWGLGAAGPRVVVLSVIRDIFEGEEMARVMSFIFGVFIIVPVLGPSIGAGLIAFAPWRSAFWLCLGFMAVVALWSTRLRETLNPSHRIDRGFGAITGAIRTVFRSRQSIGYLLTISFIFGVFTSYLASSELIWDDVFDKGSLFPLLFGALALVMAGALFTNAAIVGRAGVKRVVRTALWSYISAAVLLAVVAVATGGRPPFWIFLPALALQLAHQGLLMPNLNALAMAPVGRVAGTASALIGSVSTVAAALVGFAIDRSFNGTVTPLSFAFLAAGVASLITVILTERTSTADAAVPPPVTVPPAVD